MAEIVLVYKSVLKSELFDLKWMATIYYYVKLCEISTARNPGLHGVKENKLKEILFGKC
jgi:hypothetical protein